MKRSTIGGIGSPFSNRDSILSKVGTGSKISMTGPSQGRSAFLDLHKKTGIELRDSPSKGSKIVMKYINNYHDVGPIVAQKPISYQNLEEMAK